MATSTPPHGGKRFNAEPASSIELRGAIERGGGNGVGRVGNGGTCT